MKIKLLLISVAGALLAGCASTRQFVPLPDQSRAIEDSSKGRIYVMRPATVGYMISMHVSDGGKLIGDTGPHGYLCWERAPGETTISSSSEGVSTAPLTVEAGATYYLFQHVRMGVVIARNELEFVTPEKGKKVLAKCKPPKVNLQSPAAGTVMPVSEPVK